MSGIKQIQNKLILNTYCMEGHYLPRQLFSYFGNIIQCFCNGGKKYFKVSNSPIKLKNNQIKF